jgi:GT2 family glycosyltransferase
MTHALLQSLAEAKARYRILVIDDGSRPPLERIGAPPGLRVQYVRRRDSAGPAAARNLGLGRVETPLVGFTDNDVVVELGWMERLAEHLLEAPADVAGVGGHVVHATNSLVGEYSTRLRLLDPYRHKGRVVYLVTANCLFRRAALLDVGGFDEAFRFPGGEDPDLSFRLLRAGYRLEEEPAAVVRHCYSPSWWAFARMFYRYGRGCRRAMEALRARAPT